MSLSDNDSGDNGSGGDMSEDVVEIVEEEEEGVADVGDVFITGEDGVTKMEKGDVTNTKISHDHRDVMLCYLMAC